MLTVVVTTALCAAVAEAAPAQMPSSPTLMPVFNDGYIVLHRAEVPSPFILVCQQGKEWMPASSWARGRSVCATPDGGSAESGTVVPPVTPQAALDMAFVRGSTLVVGVAPLYTPSRELTVVYYRRIPKQ